MFCSSQSNEDYNECDYHHNAADISSFHTVPNTTSCQKFPSFFIDNITVHLYMRQQSYESNNTDMSIHHGRK